MILWFHEGHCTQALPCQNHHSPQGWRGGQHCCPQAACSFHVFCTAIGCARTPDPGLWWCCAHLCPVLVPLQLLLSWSVNHSKACSTLSALWGKYLEMCARGVPPCILSSHKHHVALLSPRSLHMTQHKLSRPAAPPALSHRMCEGIGLLFSGLSLKRPVCAPQQAVAWTHTEVCSLHRTTEPAASWFHGCPLKLLL